jgi:GNAT superfamily N-acetyltransferase
MPIQHRLSRMQIRPAITPDEIAVARILFAEYAAALKIDLGFQNFADELAQLPGPYVPPRGRLFIAWFDETAAGCAALRPLFDDVCEMKRMYVRPAFRGRGVGRRLAEAIIAAARQIGYVRMRLDTLPQMSAATGLYESLGFTRRSAYYDTPLAHTIFMELVL